MLRNRFLSKTDLSAGWPGLQSRYPSHLFSSHICDFFASFSFCLQTSLHRGQSWNWNWRSGALSVLATLTFCLTPPASISHHSFCFGEIMEIVISRSGASFLNTKSFDINVYIPFFEFWTGMLSVYFGFELRVKLIWRKSVALQTFTENWLLCIAPSLLAPVLYQVGLYFNGWSASISSHLWAIIKRQRKSWKERKVEETQR